MSDTESIHDLFAKVKAHPDFRFGTIFVADDLPDDAPTDPGAYRGFRDYMTESANQSIADRLWE